MKLANVSVGSGEPQVAVVAGEALVALTDAGLAELNLHSVGGQTVTLVDDYVRLSDAGKAEFRERVQEADLASRARSPYAFDAVRYYPPVLRPGKVMAAGRNFGRHLEEAKQLWKERGFDDVVQPEIPTGFVKVNSALIGHHEPVRVPRWIENVDYEGELLVIMGKTADGITEDEALAHVAGYSIANDISARKLQFAERESGGGPAAGKNPRTFGPCGPWLTTLDEFDDPMDMRVWTKVNGELKQDERTTDMIFDVKQLIAFWSQIGWDPGDMIMSGTPEGVGAGTGSFLRVGDVVECGVDGIGVLVNQLEEF
jgi:2-keto-4-pentenoate hydratase/2-oxohepta-3-ene-1,7-dioic acid hydratase in catechol pathway